VQLATLPNGPGPNTGSSYVGLSSFGVDQEGELYLCQMSSEAGHIYRLERTGPPAARKPFPRLLSQTGAFIDTTRLIPAPGLISYTVNSPLWSDGAVKARWMALPEGTKIDFAEKGEWKFPNGTVFVKHFELPVDERHPEKRVRLETRLLVRDSGGSAYGVTYKWRADNSDADLLPDAFAENISIRQADGAARVQEWSYPSQTDCTRCHTAAGGFVLGPKTRQLNGEAVYAGNVRDNQLREWNHLGLFNPPLDETKISGFDKLVSTADPRAPLEQRVRSYLDANCAQCHRPGGVQALWDARYDTPLAETHIVNAPVINRLGIAGAKVVRAGDLHRSVLYQRIAALDPAAKMPPLARNTVDVPALTAFVQWITTLPAPTDTLPGPWLADDIGAVQMPGDARLAAGAFTVSGAGADIWDAADAFQFVYQPLHGDGQIVAHVASVGETDGWAKAGVMIRDTIDPGARHAFILLTPSSGAAFQRRATAGGGSEHTAGPNVRAPYWVKLERKGSNFTGSISTDGVNWTKVGDAAIEMGADLFAGLAVTAHNNGALCTAAFDHVAIGK
jgi:uncharacterized repeat protein (TIGR03806 family)